MRHEHAIIVFTLQAGTKYRTVPYRALVVYYHVASVGREGGAYPVVVGEKRRLPPGGWRFVCELIILGGVMLSSIFTGLMYVKYGIRQTTTAAAPKDRSILAGLVDHSGKKSTKRSEP